LVHTAHLLAVNLRADVILSGVTGTVVDSRSYRVGKYATSEHHAVGLDRLSVTFPVRCADRFQPSRDLITLDEQGQIRGQRRSKSAHVAGTSQKAHVHFGVYLAQGQLRGRVELNPSRLVDPTGFGLMPVGSASVTVEAMLSMAEQNGIDHSLANLQQVRVTRVDVARDFAGISEPPIYFAGLHPLKRSYARECVLHLHPATSVPTSLRVGSSAGVVQLYDQHHHRPNLAPPGAVRFEVQAREGWLDKAGIATAEDLTGDVLEALARNRWEWSKMGTTVSRTVNVVAAIDRKVAAKEPGWTTTTSFRLMGMLFREEHGLSVTQSANTQRKYEQMRSELGITSVAQPRVVIPDVAIAGRLDFESGVEVTG
jgi:hypothetical protein